MPQLYKCKKCGGSYPGSKIAKITEHRFVCKGCVKSKPARVNPRLKSGERVKHLLGLKGTVINEAPAFGLVRVRWDMGKTTDIGGNQLTRIHAGPKGKLPNPTVIYGRVLRIEAEKTQNHKCDAACKRAGHRYFHDFKKGSKATIIGMPAGVDSPDRSLRIVSKEKK